MSVPKPIFSICKNNFFIFLFFLILNFLNINNAVSAPKVKVAPPEVSSFTSTKYRVKGNEPFTLSWQKNPNYSGTVRYELSKKFNTSDYGTFEFSTTSTVEKQVYWGIWTYKIKACAAGVSNTCGAQKVITVEVYNAPSPVTGLVLSQNTAEVGSGVNIGWDEPPKFPFSSKNITYNLYESDSNSTNSASLNLIASGLNVFQYLHPISFVGSNFIYVEACYAGNACSDLVNVEILGESIPVGDQLPPDPATIAPALNPTKVTSMKDSVAFLYTGENPIQTGVNPNDISAKRVAVVKGKVLNRDNTPLSGVTISIKGHTEFGQTLSRTDGEFDMAINGGDIVTIDYIKEGYLPVQRQIDTPWRDFIVSTDVVMLPLDPQVTTIDLTSSQPIQVAQGSLQTDADGERQATLFFPKGTTATMTLPSGSTQELSTLNVRATEYTVGENGRNAMPGELPTFSGYTYAVELSVDEAIVVGATRIDFSQEIPVYVDNFLEFPTGEIVPVGWYDHTLSTWMPSKNGRIVEILSIDNGLARLDVKGGSVVAEQAALDELGIDEEELRQLALTFSVGKRLWRMPITHFTPWDGNWPYGFPMDAEPPLNEEPETADDDELDEDEEDECEGCIIKAQSQTLGESIPVVGSGFSINYRSDRVKGHNKKNVLRIPLTGDSVPETLIGINVTISILGQKHVQKLPPSANLIVDFTWDGLNAFGQSVNSGLANVIIEFEYPPVYYPANDDFRESFGRIREQGGSIGFRGDGERKLALDRKWSKMLFSSGDLGNTLTAVNALGAWSFSDMHVYDVNAKELLLGTGGKATTKRINNYVVYDEVGNGNEGNTENGILALEAELFSPSSLAISASGIIYFVDGDLIKKIDSKG